MVNPKIVKNPENRLKDLTVLVDGTKNKGMGYSIAYFLWDDVPSIGFRWDGCKKNDAKYPYKTGFPFMNGCSTWMVIPKEFYPVIDAILEDSGTITEPFADYFFFRCTKETNYQT